MLSIAHYQPEEKDEIVQLMFALNSEDDEELPLSNEKVHTFFEFIKTDSSNQLFTIKQDSLLIGYCIVITFFSNEFGGECLEIDELYIKPNFRNKGLGKEVMQYLEGYARSKKLVMMFLIATSNNKRAQRFYERFGFKKLPRVEYIKELV